MSCRQVASLSLGLFGLTNLARLGSLSLQSRRIYTVTQGRQPEKRPSERERVIYGQPTGPNQPIIVMIRWTGLAPWEFEFPFSRSWASKFLEKPFNPSEAVLRFLAPHTHVD